MNKNQVLKLMLLRQPKLKQAKLHPKALAKRIQYSQPLEPLAFKLQDVQNLTAADMFYPHSKHRFKPLGVKQDLPFAVYRSTNGNLPVYRDYKNRRYHHNPNSKAMCHGP
jgi:hypothetical protein